MLYYVIKGVVILPIEHLPPHGLLQVCVKQPVVHSFLLPHHGLATTPHPLNSLRVRASDGVHKILAVVHCLVRVTNC